MDYFESAQGKQITLKRALLELKRHGAESETASFMVECWAVHSDGKTIDAQDVLAWLGY